MHHTLNQPHGKIAESEIFCFQEKKLKFNELTQSIT